MVERGDLGDHPAHADARQMRRPVVEMPGERRGVGGKIAQRVRRVLLACRRAVEGARIEDADLAAATRLLAAPGDGAPEMIP